MIRNVINPSPSSALDALIERYEVGGHVLRLAVRDLTPEQLQARPGPEPWSIAEVVGHLADSDQILSNRMKWVIAEENPALPYADETAWVERLRSHDVDVNLCVDLFDLNRKAMTRVLRSLDASDFARVGQHATRGRVTLAELVVTTASHLDHHLRHLYSKRSRLGVAVQPRYTREQNQ